MALTKVPSNLDATVAITQSASDNSTNVATTAYVTTALANLVDGAPSTLNTLDEIAAALNDDAALNTTLTTSIAAKLPLAGGTMSGALNMGGENIGNIGTISSGAITSTGITSTGAISASGTITTTGGNIDIRKDGTGDGVNGYDINFMNSAAQGTDDRLALIRVTNQGGDSTSRGGKLTLLTRQSGSANFNSTLILDKDGDATFAGNISAGVFSTSAHTGTFSNSIGSFPLVTSTPYDYVAKFESTDSGASIIIEDSSSTNNGNRVSVSGDAMSFWTGATKALTVDGSQNIGVGLTPSGYLTSGYKLRLDGGTQTYLAFNNSTHTTQVLGGFVIGHDASAARITQRENQPIIIATNDTTAVTIQNDGQVVFAKPISITTSNSAEINMTGSASGNIVAANDLYIMAGSGTGSGNLYFGSDGTNAQFYLDGGQLTTQGITAVSTGNYSTGNVGLIAKSVGSRGTVRIRSDGDNAAELFFDVNGGIRWDLSTRSSSSNYDLLMYPQHGTPSLTAVAGHVFRFTQTGHLGIGTNTSARSGLDVDGAVTSSNSDNDLGTHSHSSYASRVGSGRIDVTAGYSGTMSSGRAFIFKYDAVSWKAFHGRITLSGTGGFSTYEFGGYWNNSGSCQIEEVKDTLNASCAFSNSGQAILLTVTIGQTVVHPCFSIEYNQSGGDGPPRMDRAEFFIQ